MKPLLFLILEYPNAGILRFDTLHELGRWQEPKWLIDAGLASALTGEPVSHHGTLSRWELRPDGQHLRETPRQRLKSSPLWERVPGAVAIGLPWSIGAQPTGTLVATDFVRTDSPGASVPLPDRVWPATLSGELSPLCIDPQELDEGSLAQLGFIPCDDATRQEIATCLSLHMIGTALLAEADHPVALLQLTLPVSENRPAASDHFVHAMINRYLEIYAHGECLLLMRYGDDEHTHCRALGSRSIPPVDSSLRVGKQLMMRFGLAAQPAKLDGMHWNFVRAAYQLPDNTLPGTSERIQTLVTDINSALDHFIASP